MFAPDAPRPARYAEAYLAQVLADREVDLTDIEACRLALVEAIGVEPDCDWLSVRTRASDVRAAERQCASVPGLIAALAVIGSVGAVCLATAARADDVGQVIAHVNVPRAVALVVGALITIGLLVLLAEWLMPARAADEAWEDDPVEITRRDGGER